VRSRRKNKSAALDNLAKWAMRPWHYVPMTTGTPPVDEMCAAVLFILLAFTVGCGSSEPPADFVPASPAQVEHIRQFLKPGASLARGYVARAHAHRNAHLFAGQIGGVQATDPLGMWLVTGPADFTGGTTYSVNTSARAYSVAPALSSPPWALSRPNPPAGELQFVQSR